MSIEPSIPLPLDPVPPPEADDKRLWIGNIDSRLTEYNLLKIVQQFGEIKKFDFLFHKSGALKGQPRGYCFVTYETREQAEKALTSLNGKPALGKDLVVKWAHTIPTESSSSKRKAEPKNSGILTEDNKQCTKSILHQIIAIEAKLKTMEEQRDKELEMCLSSLPPNVDRRMLPDRKTLLIRRKPGRAIPYLKCERKPSAVHKG